MTRTSFLSLSSSNWSWPYWTSRQFLTFELAQIADVIYSTARPQWRSTLSALSDFRKAAPFSAPPRLILTPPVIPQMHRFRGIDNLLCGAYVRRLQRLLDKGNPETRVVYCWEPGFASIADRLEKDCLIYHPYDMFRHFKGANQQLIDNEEWLCRQADALVTPHRNVADALKHPNSHVMGNGLFLQAFPHPDLVEPASAISSIQSPVVGYIGTVNDKVDFELLLRVFKTRRDWNLVLVGAEYIDEKQAKDAVSQLKDLSNVHFINPVSFDKVASVVRAFDVGIIPYRLSGWAGFSESPLKLYQYWAMGVPIVCSPLPNIESVEAGLQIATEPAEWISAIEDQLVNRTDDSREALRSRAASRDWSTNAKKVAEIVSDVGRQ